MVVSQSQGQVITFYSYKGGTGRSMALANVACLLAQQTENQPILMIDWDLEAPGLHRYFQDELHHHYSEEELNRHPGLIDLFWELEGAIANLTGLEEETEEIKKILDQLQLEKFVLETGVDSLHLIKAGCFDDDYSRKVNSFQWVSFFDKAPSLIQLLAEQLVKRYRYVLIDSRTGVTDISGICTTLMPDELVAVFTPNHQSIIGVIEQVKKAANYRRQSDDLRPLVVFPLPSRIDSTVEEMREFWRFGNFSKQIEGYQKQFERLFQDIYDLPECNLNPYFDDIQIQYTPSYAYGEEVAVLSQRIKDRFSLVKSYETFTAQLINLSAPWNYKHSEEPYQRSDTPRINRPTDYDVLISYNSKDLPEVKEIVTRLRERGIRPWFDQWELRPGEPWQRALELGIQRSSCIVIFFGENGFGPFQNAELRDLLRESIAEQRSIIPVRLSSASQDLEIPSLLKRVAWVDFHTQDPDPLEQLIWGITGKKPE